jgi:hypothetical protein
MNISILFQIIQHKEAVSGKRCPLRLGADLLRTLQRFLQFGTPEHIKSEFAFTTYSPAGKISPSVSIIPSVLIV